MTIYFIQVGASGPIKIGHARNVAARFSALQSGHYERLFIRGVLPGGPAAERALRKQLTRHLIRGEWFKPAEPVLVAMRSARRPGPDLELLNDDGPLSGCRRYHCRVMRVDGGYDTFDMRGW